MEKKSRYVARTLKEKSDIHKAKLEKEGRYSKGKYYVKGGTALVLGYWSNGVFVEPEGGLPVAYKAREIDEKLLNKFKDLWEGMIRSHFPARYVWGAAWDYKDLESLCRTETFKALSETFDPDKMRSGVGACKTAAARAKRYADEKELCRDLENLLYVSQRGWVKERLKNFLWRSQFKFHPQQLGGVTQSMTPLSDEKTNNNEVKLNLFYETRIHSPETIKKTEELVVMMEKIGSEDAVKMFYSFDRGTREDIVDLIDSRRDRTLDMAMAEDSLREAMGKTPADLST
jgi:hypothetical protein